MAHFSRDLTIKSPFGVNQFLRSTQDVKRESYTLAAASIPAKTVDGVSGYKYAQRGMVMAKITSGPDAGKIGPFQAAGTAEAQTLTPSGTISGGTWTITYAGQTTSALAYNATAATIQAALEALNNIVPGDVLVSGGPISSGVVTLTFYGNLSGDVAQVTVGVGSLTGSTPGLAVATGTGGVAGAADGRQQSSNIVGILETVLPWQTTEHDVEVAVVYECAAVQGWCFEMDTSANLIALTNTTAAFMQPGAAAGKSVNIVWK